jgi:hypothetical protein
VADAGAIVKRDRARPDAHSNERITSFSFYSPTV